MLDEDEADAYALLVGARFADGLPQSLRGEFASEGCKPS